MALTDCVGEVEAVEVRDCVPLAVKLPLREAADLCFSPSNAEAVLQLPHFVVMPA